MKSKDRIKEEIGLHKLLLTIFSAIDVSLVSFVWKNGKILTDLEALSFWLGGIFILALIFLIYLRINKKIKNLDKYV